MKFLSHIGTLEQVSLPLEGLQNVPAKIDTGADSSAIWASNVVDQGQQLSFVLFAKASPFYTGNILTTKNYQVVSIKNSFGQTEYRYKVYLQLILAGRTIRARFTLADRQNNRYPILIGRRTLYGKFVVNVARRPAGQSNEILLLSTKHTVATANFTQNLERQNKKLQITYATYSDLIFITGQPGNQIILKTDKRDIASFDMVYFKTTKGKQDVAASMAHYLEKRNVPYFDRAIKYIPFSSKLYQYIILTDHDIPVPKTVYLPPEQLANSYSYLQVSLGLPFVLKDIHGQRGNYNFLITDQATFMAACKVATKEDIWFIAQAYIDNDGDYRLLVFGRKVELVLYRTRNPELTHLNNTSQGGKASLVTADTLPAGAQLASVQAAKLLERQIAGVDIVADKHSGVWYCLEVNDGPQLATGSFREEKQAALAAYLERRLRR